MKRSRKKSNHELIEDILDEFDFNGVRRVMESLNWRWARTDDVPPVAEMRKTARRLLEEMCTNDEMDSLATGGFEVIRRDEGLELRFIIHEAWGKIHTDRVIRSLILQ
jgi:hypothetical protein